MTIFILSPQFLIITDSNAECSNWVEQEEGADLAESYGDWYPRECHLPTSHAYVVTEADGENLYRQILSGGDWHQLEGKELLHTFTDQILAGAEPHAVLLRLRAHGHSTAASS